MNTINAYKSRGFAWIWELRLLCTGFYSMHQFAKIVKHYLNRLMSQFSVTSLLKSSIPIPKDTIHVNKNGEKSHRLIVGYQVASYNTVGGGGVKKSENFADVICTFPLIQMWKKSWGD